MITITLTQSIENKQKRTLPFRIKPVSFNFAAQNASQNAVRVLLPTVTFAKRD
jgi:hypothetical protein